MRLRLQLTALALCASVLRQGTHADGLRGARALQTTTSEAPFDLNLWVVKGQGASGFTELHGLNAAAQYQQYIYNVATPIPATVFPAASHMLAANGDLFSVSEVSPTELRITIVPEIGDGPLPYAGGNEVVLFAPLPICATPGSCTYLMDALRNIFVIKRSATDSASTEVHILSAITSYQNYLYHTATPLPETDASWGFAISPFSGDIYGIKTQLTPTGFVEVHALSAAENWAAFAQQTITAWPVSFGEPLQFQLLLNDDLAIIKQAATGTGFSEVHILTAASKYQEYSLQVPTPVELSDPNYRWLTKPQPRGFLPIQAADSPVLPALGPAAQPLTYASLADLANQGNCVDTVSIVSGVLGVLGGLISLDPLGLVSGALGISSGASCANGLLQQYVEAIIVQMEANKKQARAELVRQAADGLNAVIDTYVQLTLPGTGTYSEDKASYVSGGAVSLNSLRATLRAYQATVSAEILKVISAKSDLTGTERVQMLPVIVTAMALEVALHSELAALTGCPLDVERVYTTAAAHCGFYSQVKEQFITEYPASEPWICLEDATCNAGPAREAWLAGFLQVARQRFDGTGEENLVCYPQSQSTGTCVPDCPWTGCVYSTAYAAKGNPELFRTICAIAAKKDTSLVRAGAVC